MKFFNKNIIFTTLIGKKNLLIFIIICFAFWYWLLIHANWQTIGYIKKKIYVNYFFIHQITIWIRNQYCKKKKWFFIYNIHIFTYHIYRTFLSKLKLIFRKYLYESTFCIVPQICDNLKIRALLYVWSQGNNLSTHERA